MKAVFNGQRHYVNGLAPVVSGSASFAIMKPSILIGANYSGTAFKVFNFPNPFNLKNKTKTIAHGSGGITTMTTDGTIIKYAVPASKSGSVTIRIYTLSGRPVA